jgi:hypothetical protein
MTVQAEDAVVQDDDQQEVEALEVDQEAEEGIGGAAPAAEAAAEADPDEVVVTIGDEPITSEDEEVARAPEWVRELRKSKREADKEVRELREKLRSLSRPQQAEALGAKPTLEGCDYDADKFEAELTAWHNRRLAAEAKAAERQRAEQAAQVQWQATLDAYGKAKAELKVSDYEDAEALAMESLNQTQQGVILHGAKNPALIVYALGRNPKKAKELASISDPVKFAFAVADLQAQLKVQPRKAAPPPEERVRGSAPVSLSSDANLARLEAEADRTGDRSKVIAYRRQLRLKRD